MKVRLVSIIQHANYNPDDFAPGHSLNRIDGSTSEVTEEIELTWYNAAGKSMDALGFWVTDTDFIELETALASPSWVRLERVTD